LRGAGQLSWPIRFTVEIRRADGPDFPVSVLTWLNEAKAVALAVAAFLRAHPTAKTYAVKVVALGPAPRSADGTVDVGDDLHDRLEF
jgi:hypothetical protein